MTPQEKAREITLLYYNLGKHLYVPITFAKQCALIAVDEIMNKDTFLINISANDILYWNEVKKEINNL